MHPVSGEMVELGRYSTRAAADEAAFLLRTVGIGSAVQPSIGGNGHPSAVWLLLVDQADRRRAAEILAEESASSAAIRREPPGGRPPLYWVVGLMVINICVFLALEGTGGSEARPNLIRFGASHAPSILAGELWRPVSAIFLHIGARHLVGNMISLGIFGPLTLRQWGVGRFYLIYVLAGAAGNLFSFAISPGPGAKAGASGSILGLLGALAGMRVAEIRLARRDDLAARRAASPSRYTTWHVVAMLVAFYGFVVGSGRADHLAHVGGIIAGFVIALLLPPPGQLPAARDRRLATACGLTASALVVFAGAATALAQLSSR